MVSAIPTFDSVQFGAAAIALRSFRQEVLTSNIVNADTPNFQARDVNFAAELRRALAASDVSSNGVTIARTHSKHFGASESRASTELYHRIPVQPAIDGNTVDPDLERSHFAKNAMMMEAALQFLSGTFKTRLAAVTGQPS